MSDHNPINIVPAYVKTIIGTIAAFYVFGFVFFYVVFLCYFGYNDSMLNNFNKLVVQSLIHPSEIFANYMLCFDLLKDLDFSQKFSLIFLFFVMCFVFIIGIINYAKYMILGSYQKVFAKESEIEYARLFSGDFHFLGTAFKKPLRLPFNNSVLSFTDKSSLNPITIATPSIFNNNECNMVIIDCNGNFQKLTAGYRGLLGKTLCFDWENKNEKNNGNFLPSWNPLSGKMLPTDDAKREKYISTLATSILSVKHPADELTTLYLQCIITFFIAKTEKALANDYFLNSLLSTKHLSDDDRALLMSYYLLMPDEVADKAKDALTEDKLNPENYLPVGSWENITEPWQGKELCLSMIYDSLLKNFADIIEQPGVVRSGLWKMILKQYKEEAELFNYPESVHTILGSLAEKTTLESDIHFTEILESLSVFKNQMIREKTVFSDFTYDEIRGFSVDNTIYPMTIYLSARTEDEKNISKILLNILINDTLENYNNQNPVVFVIDDTQGLGYINSLSSGIGLGERANISFLVFNNDVSTFKAVYGEKNFADIIQNTSYIMLAADTVEKHKKLLSATANAYTEDYLDDIFKSVEKLATTGDDNAILIQNDETPLFIQTKLFSRQENAKAFDDLIVPAEPYIDEFIKAGRPAFFETVAIPKVYEEKPVPKRGRKKKVQETTDETTAVDVDEWWLDEASFLPKDTSIDKE